VIDEFKLKGWAERAVFGKIRFMNFKGCQRKFDVDGFISKYISKERISFEPKKKKSKTMS